MDTLKPVIALKFGGEYLHISKDEEATDKDSGSGSSTTTGANGEANPAALYYTKITQDIRVGQKEGAAPWLRPSNNNWVNPRNIQASETACIEQCKALPTCQYGTFMRYVGGVGGVGADSGRDGECWLSAHAAQVQEGQAAEHCATCTGFVISSASASVGVKSPGLMAYGDDVAYDDHMAFASRGSWSWMAAPVIAVAVAVSGLAMFAARLHRTRTAPAPTLELEIAV